MPTLAELLGTQQKSADTTSAGIKLRGTHFTTVSGKPVKVSLKNDEAWLEQAEKDSKVIDNIAITMEAYGVDSPEELPQQVQVNLGLRDKVEIEPANTTMKLMDWDDLDWEGCPYCVKISRQSIDFGAIKYGSDLIKGDPKHRIPTYTVKFQSIG
ncbi:MAG: hypothetical protein IJ072_03340, partial [Oscillospiraceae bacterium]|nr:hypothetical protein [Oscillospiraceae bacterium]